jgi:hypothetical protein
MDQAYFMLFMDLEIVAGIQVKVAKYPFAMFNFTLIRMALINDIRRYPARR